MKSTRLVLTGLLLTAASLVAIAQTCTVPPGVQGEQDPARIQQAALALLPCLASPDPTQRDGVALTLLSTWARTAKLQPATLQAMRSLLTAVLDGPPDAAGVHQPFAAVTLAEVARVDRLQPYLTAEQREDLVAHAVRYLAGVRDYRGFDPVDGWRHGVAHGADLALQLGMNDAVTAAQRERLLAAVQQQVLADHRHAYRFGEGARLARAALNLHLKAGTDAAGWQRWIDALVAPLLARKSLDESAFTDWHNLREFLWPLLAFALDIPDATQREPLERAVRQALHQFPT